MKTIKIKKETYRLVKEIARDRGCFLSKILDDAVKLLAQKEQKP